MRIVVLVCRRADGGHRDKLWAYARQWWEKNLPWPIYEGHHEEGLFSRAVAFNRAAQAAGDWSAALLIDSDIFLGDPQQAFDAINNAIETGQMHFAHHWRFALNQTFTDELIAGARAIPEMPWEKGIEGHFSHVLESDTGSYGPTYSSCQAIRRDLWEKIGGLDERFAGWGCEDWAFWTACYALAGQKMGRIHGSVFHLWHPRSRENQEGHAMFQQNAALGHRYMAVRDEPENMKRIVEEWLALRASRVDNQPV